MIDYKGIKFNDWAEIKFIKISTTVGGTKIIKTINDVEGCYLEYIFYGRLHGIKIDDSNKCLFFWKDKLLW